MLKVQRLSPVTIELLRIVNGIEAARLYCNNVAVMPSSFYVHAKNKQGDAVSMVIGPEG